MSRDFLYEFEMMPSKTDAEFVAMVKMATAEGNFFTSHMARLIAIAERAIQRDEKP